jgi:YHS domain-containing protein
MKTHKQTRYGYVGLAFLVTLLFSTQAAIAESYPLGTCPVSGEKLGSMGDPVVKVYDGREIRFCCAGCPKKFEANQTASLEKIDAAIVKEQTPYYPMKTCVVSGEKLDSMDAPIDYVYQNRLVRFCCKGCIKKFEADPAKYLAEIDKKVIAEQKASYPLTTCVTSGEKFGGDMGDPIEYVFANRLVRLCCKGCKKDFLKDPAKYLAKLDEAGSATKSADAHGAHKH